MYIQSWYIILHYISRNTIILDVENEDISHDIEHEYNHISMHDDM